jgi:DNA-binding response OmpR family regulator
VHGKPEGSLKIRVSRRAFRELSDFAGILVPAIQECTAMRVLIVEDERRMARLLQRGLEEEGCAVAVARDGIGGLELAEGAEFDLIVLDLMLPGIDGWEVARRLRRIGNRTPILMLTARDSVQDIVRGLDLGADDYLTKPFSFEVLLARVRALLRRGPAPLPAQLRVGELVLDPANHQVSYAGQRLRLTRTEYRLLEFLMRRTNRVVERDTLVAAVWGYDREIESNTLDAFIRLLRIKLEERGAHGLIRTVRGVGYLLGDREDE